MDSVAGGPQQEAASASPPVVNGTPVRPEGTLRPRAGGAKCENSSFSVNINPQKAQQLEKVRAPPKKADASPFQKNGSVILWDQVSITALERAASVSTDARCQEAHLT